MGVINITVNASAQQLLEAPPLWDDGGVSQGNDPYSGSGSTSIDHVKYSYRFFFDNKTDSVSFKSDEATFLTNRSFTSEGNNSFIVEVISRNTTNGTTHVYYGEKTITLEVYGRPSIIIIIRYSLI